MFECINGDWFSALFPLVDVELDKMKEYYIGKYFYDTKKDYKGRVFSEHGKDA